jgi:hypothetical protein
MNALVVSLRSWPQSISFIGYIIGRKVTFLLGKTPVERAQALKSMKAA